MSTKHFLRTMCAVLGLGLALLMAARSAEAREVRLSHQMPESDARHKASRVLAIELRKRAPDLVLSIHPNSSLIADPVKQYDAQGALKINPNPVAGQANVLVVPNLEAGNMVAKQLQYLAGADSAGIVLGARVPIVLTSRADSVRTRLASAAVAALVAQRRRQAAPVAG